MIFFSFFSFLNGIINIVLGLFILSKHKIKIDNILFFLFTFSIFLWNIGYGLMYFSSDLAKALFYAKIGTVGIILIPFFGHLYISKILDKKQLIVNLFIFVYVLILFFILFNYGFYSSINSYIWGNYPTANRYNILNIIFFICIFSKICIDIYKYILNNRLKENKKYLYLLFAFIIGAFGFIDWIPNYYDNFFPVAFFLSFSWVAIITFTITKHELMDIKVVISKSIANVLIVSFILILSAVVSLFLINYFFVFFILSILSLIWMFFGEKIRLAIQTTADEKWITDYYNSDYVIQGIIDKLLYVTSKEEIIKTTASYLKSYLKLSAAYSVIKHKQKSNYFEVYNDELAKVGSIKTTDSFITTFKNKEDVFFYKDYIVYETEEKKKKWRNLFLHSKIFVTGLFKKKTKKKKEINISNLPINISLKKDIIYPVFFKEKLIGIFIFQQKISESAFESKDFDLLQTIINKELQVFFSMCEQYEKEQMARAEAEKANQAKSVFLTTISHEMNTPLNGLNLIDLVFDTPDIPKEEIMEMLTQTKKSKERLEHIVKDILAVQDLDKKLMPNIKPTTLSFVFNNIGSINLDIFVKEKTDELKIERQLPKNFVFEKNVSDTVLNTEIKTDPKLIANILRRLLSNAMWFTNEGKINLGIDIKKNNLIIEVKDTGVGIAKDDLDRIFKPFERVEDVMTRSAQGSGIGLALTKKDVETLNGAIEVESELGKGSIFRVNIPLN